MSKLCVEVVWENEFIQGRRVVDWDSTVAAFEIRLQDYCGDMPVNRGGYVLSSQERRDIHAAMRKKRDHVKTETPINPPPFSDLIVEGLELSDVEKAELDERRAVLLSAGGPPVGVEVLPKTRAIVDGRHQLGREVIELPDEAETNPEEKVQLVGQVAHRDEEFHYLTTALLLFLQGPRQLALCD